MSDPIDIVARLSGMSADHGPDGWPAVQMRDITALCEEVTRLRAELAEAQKLARDDFDLRAEQRDERDRLRADFAALQHALVGDTGASAIETAHRLRAALAQAGAPEGWQLVPVEPAPEMIWAFAKEWHRPHESTMRSALSAMLAAAPTAQAGAGRGPRELDRHGWVRPRADGAKARCGGPAMCKHCQGEQLLIAAHPSPAQREPLSDDAALDIAECMRPVLKFAGDWRLALNYCRAVERAHGITTSGTKGAAMSANIMERLRGALAAAQNFRGDLDGDDFEDVCAGLRFSATQAAPSLLAQLDAHAAEITRLRAALAQAGAGRGPAAEIVTVRHFHEYDGSALEDTTGYLVTSVRLLGPEPTKEGTQPLYFGAAHPSPAQREPLSDDAALDIAECMRPVLKFAGDWRLALNYCRAVERAHGITTSGTKGAAS